METIGEYLDRKISEREERNKALFADFAKASSRIREREDAQREQDRQAAIDKAGIEFDMKWERQHPGANKKTSDDLAKLAAKICKD